jgi:hypothetical protein
MAGCRFEVHHRIPRCLLGFYDGSVASDLDTASRPGSSRRRKSYVTVWARTSPARSSSSRSKPPPLRLRPPRTARATRRPATSLAGFGVGLAHAGPLRPRLVRAPGRQALGKDHRGAAGPILRAPKRGRTSGPPTLLPRTTGGKGQGSHAARWHRRGLRRVPGQPPFHRATPDANDATDAVGRYSPLGQSGGRWLGCHRSSAARQAHTASERPSGPSPSPRIVL